MAVKKGYKQTEVGVIPEDWQINRLGNCVRITSGRSPSTLRFSDRGIPYFKVEQLSNSGKYLCAGDTPYVVKDCSSVPASSVVFAKRGGAIALNKIRILNQASFMDTNLMALTSVSDLTVEYLFYSLSYIGLWQFADTTSVPQINNKHIKPLPIPFPPTLAEQQAIAGALSDADAWIESLEQLIAKKRQIKQGVMQELLTAKRRLPGFSGKWETKLLGEFLVSHPQYGINAAAVPYSDKLSVYIRITDITEYGQYAPNPRVCVHASDVSGYFLADGDLVVARTGASVGKSYRYRIADGPLVFAGFLIRIRPNAQQLNPRFLEGYIAGEKYWNWVRLMSMRSGQPGINGNEYAQLPIELPSIAEQTAIATVLSDMDTEIESLESKLAKAREVKQGMMQELLTGRIRLGTQ